MAVPTIFAGARQHRSYQEVLEDYGKITRIAITVMESGVVNGMERCLLNGIP